MEQVLLQLRGGISGAITSSERARAAVSQDGSLFEITSDVVVTPKSVADVKTLVRLIADKKATHPLLSITPRGAGTSLSGAAIGSSFVLDMQSLSSIRHFSSRLITAQPGARIDDLQRILGAHSLELASAPESSVGSTLGGMVAHNSAGPHSDLHGNTQAWVRSISIVLTDGNEYVVRPLKKAELERKIAEPTFEGRLYAHLLSLLEQQYDTIRNARPYARWNTSGYNLWDVWDREAGIFDLTQLLIGSEGTLGVITQVTIEAAPKMTHVQKLSLPAVPLKKIQPILDRMKILGALSVDAFHDSKTSLVIECGAQTAEGLVSQVEAVCENLVETGIDLRSIRYDAPDAPQTHTLIDDLAVHPRHVVSFARRLEKILKSRRVAAKIHFQPLSGTFCITSERPWRGTGEALEAVLRDCVHLVREFDGTLSARHGDGLVRGPWLDAQYGPEVTALFKRVKELFDPLYIFNPHKKTDAAWEYTVDHLRPSVPKRRRTLRG